MRRLIFFVFLGLISTSFFVQAKQVCVKSLRTTKGMLKGTKAKIRVSKDSYFFATKISKNKKYLLVQSAEGPLWVLKKRFKRTFPSDCRPVSEENVAQESSEDSGDERKEVVEVSAWDEDEGSGGSTPVREEDQIQTSSDRYKDESDDGLSTGSMESFFGVELAYGMLNSATFMKDLLNDIGDVNDVNVNGYNDPLVQDVESLPSLRISAFYEHFIYSTWSMKWDLAYAMKSYQYTFYENPDSLGTVPLSSLTAKNQQFDLNSVQLIWMNRWYLYGGPRSFYITANAGLGLEYALSTFTHKYRVKGSSTQKEQVVKKEDIIFSLIPAMSIGWKWIHFDLEVGVDQDFGLDGINFGIGVKY